MLEGLQRRNLSKLTAVLSIRCLAFWRLVLSCRPASTNSRTAPAPWTERALDDLKQNHPDCQWLFHRAGRHIKDFRKGRVNANACEAAGADASLFHDLRRSAVRNMGSPPSRDP